MARRARPAEPPNDRPLDLPRGWRTADRERGAMLIIALGVLALMVILGTAFAGIMRLEKKATENYVEATRMDMLLESALDRIIAELQGARSYNNYTFYGATTPPRWLNRLPGGPTDDLANGRISLEDDRNDKIWKWEVFAEQVGQTYGYKTRVLDCSSQLNLNGRQDTLARMIDNLGEAIDRSARLKLEGKLITNPMYTGPNRSGQRVKGSMVVQLRRRLPGGQFTSKKQLIQIIGPENFEILKDFVTVHSWEDPHTYRASDGIDEVVDIGMGSTGGGGRGLGGGGTQPQDPAEMSAARIAPEPRHPINVNTAPIEVLTAAIQDFACRRLFPYSKLGAGGGLVQVDGNALILGERVIAQEEVRDVTPRAVFVYTPRLTYDQAWKLAMEIDRTRKNKPFMTWRTNNEAGQLGFEDFIDGLKATDFPSPNTCEVVDPDMPSVTTLTSTIRNATTPVGRLWVKGHGIGTVGTVRRQLGLSMHDSYAWYYDMIKGGLKANFNPNTRLSRHNPNAPVFNPVDKSDLVHFAQRTTLLKSHTTEFCFDTNGIFEINTLARIARTRPPEGGPRTAVGGVSPLDRPDYEKKHRAIVKIFDVMRHTSQFHFERSFSTLSRSSKQNRKNVVTYPEPMAALTELVSAGSLRDGNVQLAGLNDGLRLQMPYQSRYQSFLNYPALMMIQSFQERSQQSYATLRRLKLSGASSLGGGGVGGALTGDPLANAIREVLNPFSRSGMRENREYYALSKMQAGTVFKNSDARWLDPLVEKEVIGTDLNPDGLSTSISRMSHLGLRHLVVPARTAILGTGGGSGGNALVGESLSQGNNNRGNVAYYTGGIGFWVKFEFDGDDPVFSGLLGCTQVIRQVTAAASDYKGSEGTQFFVFKNSVGELRVVRMYYHQAFLDVGGTGGSGGSDESGGYQLYPDPNMDTSGAGGAGGLENPIVAELDPKKLISRSDLVVDVKHFKAHEWHHIAIEWNDENTSFPVKIFLDFKEMQEAIPRLAQATRDTIPRSWVRLNERQPKDGLQIAGIVRDQGVSDAGVFKWFTNTARASSSGGVKVYAQSVKRLLANATIDEVVTFDGTFAAARQYYGGRAAPGYFSVQPGEYANVFEIPLPADVDHVILRSFDWTSYYPALYTDSRLNSVPQVFPQKTPMRCAVNFRSDLSPPSEFPEPWRTPTVANRVAGRKALAAAGSPIKARTAEVVYTFNMVGARAAVGNQAGGVVQSPVIDDVTLTYFLPHPKILLEEEDD